LLLHKILIVYKELQRFVLQQKIVRSISIFLRLESNNNDKNYRSFIEKEEQKKRKEQKFSINKSILEIINSLRSIKRLIDLVFAFSIGFVEDFATILSC